MRVVTVTHGHNIYEFKEISEAVVFAGQMLTHIGDPEAVRITPIELSVYDNEETEDDMARVDEDGDVS